MQEAITWICVDQDLRRYIAWLGHNEFRPKADFRIVLGSLTLAFLLIQSDGWLPISGSSILGLPSKFLKQNFPLGCPKNLISYLIRYKLTCPRANFTGKAPKLKFYSSGVTRQPLILHTPHASSYVFLVLSYPWCHVIINKGYETDGINNNNFIYFYMYLVIIIIINFTEDFNRSFLELRLDLKSPELELELELKFLELELELKLIVSSGIGIENNGIGIELKKWNWPQPCNWHPIAPPCGWDIGGLLWVQSYEYDLYFTMVIAVLYSILCCTGPCYNSTWLYVYIYRKTSSISRTKSQNLNVSSSPLAVVFAQSIEAGC